MTFLFNSPSYRISQLNRLHILWHLHPQTDTNHVYKIPKHIYTFFLYYLVHNTQQHYRQMVQTTNKKGKSRSLSLYSTIKVTATLDGTTSKPFSLFLLLILIHRHYWLREKILKSSSFFFSSYFFNLFSSIHPSIYTINQPRTQKKLYNKQTSRFPLNSKPGRWWWWWYVFRRNTLLCLANQLKWVLWDIYNLFILSRRKQVAHVNHGVEWICNV